MGHRSYSRFTAVSGVGLNLWTVCPVQHHLMVCRVLGANSLYKVAVNNIIAELNHVKKPREREVKHRTQKEEIDVAPLPVALVLLLPQPVKCGDTICFALTHLAGFAPTRLLFPPFRSVHGGGKALPLWQCWGLHQLSAGQITGQWGVTSPQQYREQPHCWLGPSCRTPAPSPRSMSSQTQREHKRIHSGLLRAIALSNCQSL